MNILFSQTRKTKVGVFRAGIVYTIPSPDHKVRTALQPHLEAEIATKLTDEEALAHGAPEAFTPKNPAPSEPERVLEDMGAEAQALIDAAAQKAEALAQRVAELEAEVTKLTEEGTEKIETAVEEAKAEAAIDLQVAVDALAEAEATHAKAIAALTDDLNAATARIAELEAPGTTQSKAKKA